MGQHVNSQVLDATKASHCTGSVSRRSRAATPGGEDRTQVRTDKSNEESTTASASISVKSAGQGRKEQTHDGRTNTCKSRKEHTQPQGQARVKENTRTLSTASTGREPEQVQDERRYEDHELCKQHEQRVPYHHDREGHQRSFGQDPRDRV